MWNATVGPLGSLPDQHLLSPRNKADTIVMMGGDEGPSPILVAASEGNCAEISRLVKAGVCGVDDDEGVGPGSTTALCIASDRGYTDIVSLLISLGVGLPHFLP